jgi:hypothetical protein
MFDSEMKRTIEEPDKFRDSNPSQYFEEIASDGF